MLKLALVAIAIVARVEAYSEGAPVIACADFTPQHGVELQDNNEAIFDLSFPNNFQSGRVIAAGFGDASYPKLNLTIKANKDGEGEWFKGFIVQAQYMSSFEPAGAFILSDNDIARHVNCTADAPEATVTHRNATEKYSVGLTWSPAPDDAPGTDYFFTYTVVKDFNTIWAGRTSVFFSFQ